MLVLTRSKRQSEIILAGGIRILVLDVRGTEVRIGIDAPRETKILRGEHREAGQLWADGGRGCDEKGADVE